jgi:hypothetical protein
MAQDFFDDVAPKLKKEKEYILIDRSKEITRPRKPVVIQTHKKCAKCEQEKELKYFSKPGKYYASYCYECVRNVAKSEYLHDRADRIKKITEWRKNNRVRVKRYNKVYRDKRRKAGKDRWRPGYIICCQCKLELPATTDYFYKWKRGYMGLRAHCRECLAVLNARSAKNKESRRFKLYKWRKSLINGDGPATRLKIKRKSSKITLRSPRNREIQQNKIMLHLIQLDNDKIQN